jgi:hypothetical protein
MIGVSYTILRYRTAWKQDMDKTQGLQSLDHGTAGKLQSLDHGTAGVCIDKISHAQS